MSYQLRRRGMLRMLHYPLSSFELRRLTEKIRPDIINPHFASGYGFAAALARGGNTPPIVLHLWGSDILVVPHKSIFHRHKTAFALRAADLVVGDSVYLIQEAGRISKLNRTEVIPWGIEEHCLAFSRKHYAFSNPLRVIVPRHHERLYNNWFLLHSIAPLLREGVITVTFPAFGSLYELFRAEAEQLVSGGIEYYQKMPRDEFLAMMATHDVCLSGSLSDSSPASLIESMALGLIPVFGDIPGVREWLAPDSGFRFSLSDMTNLREIISDIARSHSSLEEMRLRNVLRVKKEAIFENNVADIITDMRELAGRETER